MKTIEFIPLDAKRYIDEKFDHKELHEKSLNIRICLERIIDIYYDFLIDDKNLNDTLYSKIKRISPYLPEKVINIFNKIRQQGNEGIHRGYDASITKSEIDISRNELKEIAKWVFLAYFKKNGIQSEAWMPTLFSVLVPSIRVEILEEYYESEQTLFVIDKLAMAYLKDNEHDKSFSFLKKAWDEKVITYSEYENLHEKIESMLPSLNRFPIAHTLNESAKYFFQIIKSIPDNDKNNFILLMSTLFAGYEDNHLTPAST